MVDNANRARVDSVRKPARRAAAGGRSLGVYGAAVWALLLLPMALATCPAAEPPNLAEIKRDSAELRAASDNVQGEIRIFRSETVKPEAFEKTPKEIGLPLTLQGTLWRSGNRFRVDYKSTSTPPGQAPRELQQSIAVDGRKVYELSSGRDPDRGMLRVLEPDTSEAAASMNSVKQRFYSHLDSLWCNGGGAFADLLQRPGAKIEASKMFPGGYSLVGVADKGAAGQLDFEATKHHPLGYFLSSAGTGDHQVKWERRVSSVDKQGRRLPSRIVDVARLGRGGYTQVVLLDLKPLEPDSPVARPITPKSFRNMGFDYQVYGSGRDGKTERIR